MAPSNGQGAMPSQTGDDGNPNKRPLRSGARLTSEEMSRRKRQRTTASDEPSEQVEDDASEVASDDTPNDDTDAGTATADDFTDRDEDEYAVEDAYENAYEDVVEDVDENAGEDAGEDEQEAQDTDRSNGSHPPRAMIHDPEVPKCLIKGRATKKFGRWKPKSGISRGLPPINDIEEIFNDMAKKATDQPKYKAILESLRDRDINVATMCSGTESPLLALRMIFKAVEDLIGSKLNFKHLFSAEIVPFKQSFIERNFHPDIIFRDIRELALESPTASTVYGGPAIIPSGVDILIAGFSCVDFSRLNNRTKELSDIGESGDTFRAILRYAKKYRPTIIILENVKTAPWNQIRAIWENDQETLDRIFNAKKTKGADFQNVWEKGDIAYAAYWQKVDTKDYYLPHTRNRGYMICIDRLKLPDADEKVEEWGKLMMRFKRPASSPLEAFLLHPDDPRLSRARNDMARTLRGDGRPRREMQWVLGEGRYQDYRMTEQLGVDRPITNWIEGGSCRMVDYAWPEWSSPQVGRVLETIEIAYLRCVQRGFDPAHKTRVWDLSQNVDRAVDTTPLGVSVCVTPSGIPFVTTRGGPLVGLEALSLQGLPIEKLLLTRETQRQLQDLAGNAMSSTVVGAALLSALLAVPEAFMTEHTIDRSATLQPENPKVAAMETRALDKSQPLDFMPSEYVSVGELCSMAACTVRLCYCEGQLSVSKFRIQVCKLCNHTTCKKCGGNPGHCYEDMDQAQARQLPQEFIRMVKRALPMRLSVVGLDQATLRSNFGGLLSKKHSKVFFQGIKRSFDQEYRFQKISRTHCWTIFYDSANSGLELSFDNGAATWSLFAKPDRGDPVNSKARRMFQQPLARMLASDLHLLRGQWQIRLPTKLASDITISSIDGIESTPSWESNLGIQSSPEADKKVWPSLRIVANPIENLPVADRISGDYELLKHCGTAFGSLYKKHVKDCLTERSLYLFFDPDPTALPKLDRFVFSTEKHRMAFQEVRQVIAHLPTSWRPSDDQSQEVRYSVHGQWVDCSATLEPFEGRELAHFAVPIKDIYVPIANGISPTPTTESHCSQEPISFLSCNVPLATLEQGSWIRGPWSMVDQRSERLTFSSFTWLTERVRSLGNFENGWRRLELPVHLKTCATCAPDLPKMLWRSVKGSKVLPYEDVRGAGAFERAVKDRPPPFATHVRIDEQGNGCLMVGMNVTTLAHRALARMEGLRFSHGITLGWRLVTQYAWPSHFSLPPFELYSNKEDQEAFHRFMGISRDLFQVLGELRPEQKRSLDWMIHQESDKVRPFFEQEVEEETLPHLGWRAEACVRKARLVKGGVLADKVGYGKTATTLALIDYRMSQAIESSKLQREGTISLKATLIIAPRTLVTQWEGQVRKFFGKKYKVLRVSTVAQMLLTPIADLRQADIIFVVWSTYMGSAYYRELSRMAAMPRRPAKGGRALNVWLDKAFDRVKAHTEKLKSSSIPEFVHFLKTERKAAREGGALLKSVPTVRLRGKKYFDAAQSSHATVCVGHDQDASNDDQTSSKIGHNNPDHELQYSNAKGDNSDDQGDAVVEPPTAPDDEDTKIEVCETDIFRSMGENRAESIEGFKSALLHMFHFARLVIDEYNFVQGTDYHLINALEADSRWVLSGTPSLDDFADIKRLASFLGINLGVDDDAAGVLKGSNLTAIRRGRTAVESFKACGSTHSPAWHSHRHAHAQTFVGQFVRQNPAELKEIPCEEIIHAVHLPATERAINMELQQQLNAQNVKFRTGGRARRDGDRVKRLNELMKSSTTAEEALLRQCSFFTVQNSAGINVKGSEACQVIVQQRQEQLDECFEELKQGLRHASWLEYWIAKAAHEKIKDNHFYKFIDFIRATQLGDSGAAHQVLELSRNAKFISKQVREDEPYPGAQEETRLGLELKLKLKEYHKEMIDEKARKEQAEKDAQAKEMENAGQGATRAGIKKGPNARKKPKPNADGLESWGIEGFLGQLDLGVDSDGELYLPPEGPGPSMSTDKRTASMVQGLRELTGHLRALAREYVCRIRSLRFLTAVRYLQLWQSSLGKASPKCSRCGEAAEDPSAFFILGMCGHYACLACRFNSSKVDVCVVRKEASCNAAAGQFQLHPASDLGYEVDDEGFYGSKMEAIVRLIKKIGNDDKDEQILLFAQFDGLMQDISKVLTAENISHYALIGRNSRQWSKHMNEFQSNTEDTKKKVLMLNLSNETAAGANLQNANHVIFVSPPLASTKQAYQAYLEQAIGRVRRYGQKRKVFVHKFLALKTIDVDIMEERSLEKLVAVKTVEDGEEMVSWEMKNIDDLTPAEMTKEWGSGYKGAGYLKSEDLVQGDLEKEDQEPVLVMDAWDDPTCVASEMNSGDETSDEDEELIDEGKGLIDEKLIGEYEQIVGPFEGFKDEDQGGSDEDVQMGEA